MALLLPVSVQVETHVLMFAALSLPPLRLARALPRGLRQIAFLKRLGEEAVRVFLGDIKVKGEFVN